MFTWCSSQPIRRRATSPGQGIRSIKSALVSTIYRNDRLHIYEQKDEQRGLLRQEAEARMATLIGRWQPVLCKAISWSCW